MEKPLTLPAATAVVLLFVGGVPAIMAFGGNIDPQTRQLGYVLFTVWCFVFVACIAWHFSLVRRQDVYPDILAELVSPEIIGQFGSTHLALLFQSHGGGLKVTALFQNLIDGPVTVHLELASVGPVKILAHRIPPLELELSSAAVVAASVVVPTNQGGQLKMEISGKCKRVTRAPKIRFRLRRALLPGLSDGWRVAAFLGGSILLGSGTTRLEVDVSPSEGVTPNQPPSWSSNVVWSPERPRSLRDITQMLSRGT